MPDVNDSSNGRPPVSAESNLAFRESGDNQPIQPRQLELPVAEAELRLRLPEVTDALARLEEAQVVTQDALEFMFSV